MEKSQKVDPLQKLLDQGLSVNVEGEDCQKIICMDDSETIKKYQKTLHRTPHLIINNQKHECPLTRATLGKFSWSVLHTFAAYYPPVPSDMNKISMLGFLTGFKDLYPCTHCRFHFAKSFDEDQPKLESQKQLSLWVCEQHNIVNKLLNKPKFQCQIENLNKRWMTGCIEESKGF